MIVDCALQTRAGHSIIPSPLFQLLPFRGLKELIGFHPNICVKKTLVRSALRSRNRNADVNKTPTPIHRPRNNFHPNIHSAPHIPSSSIAQHVSLIQFTLPTGLEKLLGFHRRSIDCVYRRKHKPGPIVDASTKEQFAPTTTHRSSPSPTTALVHHARNQSDLIGFFAWACQLKHQCRSVIPSPCDWTLLCQHDNLHPLARTFSPNRRRNTLATCQQQASVH